jgi:hypothetical protein
LIVPVSNTEEFEINDRGGIIPQVRKVFPDRFQELNRIDWGFTM